MPRRHAIARVSASVFAALLLAQTATALLAHVHARVPAEDVRAVGDAAPPSPHPGPGDHGLLDCRACRLRADLDRQAPAPSALEPTRDAGVVFRLAWRDAGEPRRVWRPGTGPARAPPVLS
jgi:hypothetical protein